MKKSRLVKNYFEGTSENCLWGERSDIDISREWLFTASVTLEGTIGRILAVISVHCVLENVSVWVSHSNGLSGYGRGLSPQEGQPEASW